MPHPLVINIAKLVRTSANKSSGEAVLDHNGVASLSKQDHLKMLEQFLDMIHQGNQKITQRNEYIKKMIKEKNVDLIPEPLIDVNEYFEDGHTLFTLAVAANVGIEFIKELQYFPGLDCKRANAKSKADAIYYAAVSGDVEVLQYLYAQNFDIISNDSFCPLNSEAQEIFTLLKLQDKHIIFSDRPSPLLVSIKSKKDNCIEFLTNELVRLITNDDVLRNYLLQRLERTDVFLQESSTSKLLIQFKKDQISILLDLAFTLAYEADCPSYIAVLIRAKYFLYSPRNLAVAARRLDLNTVQYMCDCGEVINNENGVCIALNAAYTSIPRGNYLAVIFTLLVRGAGISLSLSIRIYNELLMPYPFIHELKLAALMIYIFAAARRKNMYHLEITLGRDETDSEEILFAMLYPQKKWPDVRVSLSDDQRDFLLSSPTVQKINNYAIGLMCLGYLFKQAKVTRNFAAVMSFADALKNKRGLTDDYEARIKEIYDAFFDAPLTGVEKSVWQQIFSFWPRKKPVEEFELTSLNNDIEHEKDKEHGHSNSKSNTG